MPLGILLTEWDSTLGAVVKAAYPAQYPLSTDETNKILMCHSISKKKDPEILEIHLQGKIILSYCAKDKIASLGYSMILLVFKEEENSTLPVYKENLNFHGMILFNQRSQDRVNYFKQMSFEVFSKKTSRKLLFIGASAVGKTSIKKTFFESASSDDLLDRPLEPTYGLVHYSYAWLDLDLGIADLAGQEMNHFLEENLKTDIDPFEGTDLIIYVFDPSYWETNALTIIEHLTKIQQKIITKAPSAKIFIFCNKIDLIQPESKKSFQHTVTDALESFSSHPIFFTSITKAFLPDLFRAMQMVLGQVSERLGDMEEIIFEMLKESHGTAVLIISKAKIHLEISTPDFPAFQFSKIVLGLAMLKELHGAFAEKLPRFWLTMPGVNLYYNELDEFSKESILILSSTQNEREMQNLHESIRIGLNYVRQFSSGNYD